MILLWFRYSTNWIQTPTALELNTQRWELLKYWVWGWMNLIKISYQHQNLKLKTFSGPSTERVSSRAWGQSEPSMFDKWSLKRENKLRNSCECDDFFFTEASQVLCGVDEVLSNLDQPSLCLSLIRSVQIFLPILSSEFKSWMTFTNIFGSSYNNFLLRHFQENRCFSQKITRL